MRFQEELAHTKIESTNERALAPTGTWSGKNDLEPKNHMTTTIIKPGCSYNIARVVTQVPQRCAPRRNYGVADFESGIACLSPHKNVSG